MTTNSIQSNEFSLLADQLYERESMPPGLSFTQFQSYPESHAFNFVSQFRTNHNYELHHRPIIGFNHHQSNHYLSNSSNLISLISKELTVLTPVVQNKVDVLNVLQPVENEVFKNKIFEENESKSDSEPTPEKNKKRGKTIVKFINDSKTRANRRNKR